jgi:nitrous oxidase accessory protein NosD
MRNGQRKSVWRPWRVGAALILGSLAAMATGGGGAPPVAERAWVPAMREVRARFRGKPGTFAQFGDSITVTMAFWSPLQSDARNASPEMRRALDRVRRYQQPECWREWKGPEYGSEGGKTTRWAEEQAAGWLARLNPEVAVIMFGTNDLHTMEVAEYRTRLRSVAERCLANGTVVILSTIPPRHGFEAKAAAFAGAAREVARALSIPLADYHAAILERRPHDWDGALESFRDYRDYDVPTLIARDGVHPSHPVRFQNDYSDASLRSSGYALRNYLVLMTYAEVIEAIQGSRPTGPVLRATNTEELFDAAARVRPGGTILLADGRYPLPRRVEIRADRVTLRGESGDRERVVLDGGGSLGEGIALTACADVTLADLTLQNVRWNGIKIDSETNVQRLTIRNCVFRNIWQRAVKGVLIPPAERDRIRPAGCRIEQCLFINERPKRFEDDPADTAETFNGNYVGGIDVMFPQGWVIRENRFVGVRGRTGEARGAVFLWHDARDCIVERNVIVDCDSGICLGNSHKPPDVAIHATRCVVRNNMITRAPENGILADYTRECRILHNTIHDPGSRLGRLIRLVHENDALLVAGNLLSGPPPGVPATRGTSVVGFGVRNESGSRITLRDNREGDLAPFFVDPAAGDLRLARPAGAAVDAARPLPDVPDDIDGRPRGPRPDIGAHEWQAEGGANATR